MFSITIGGSVALVFLSLLIWLVTLPFMPRQDDTAAMAIGAWGRDGGERLTGWG